MFKYIIYIIAFITLLSGCMPRSIGAQSIYVPLEHWVYDLIDKLEIKGNISIALNDTRPMTRDDVIKTLQSIENEALLNRIEKQQISQLKQAWYMDWKQDSPKNTRWNKLSRSRYVDPWLPDLILSDGVHILAARTGPLKLYANPVIIRSRRYATADTLQKTEYEFSDGNGFVLWGTIGSFSFFSDVRDTRDYGNRSYPQGNSTAFGLGFVQGSKGQMYHDETTAYVTYHNTNLDIMYGKAKNQWGPGRTGQLMLSDAATSYDQIKLQLSLPRLKYTSMLAWLKHYTPEYYAGNAQTKLLAAHRIEFTPWNWLELGLQESVVYSGRTFEPAYLNPVMFFRSAEHYLGDQDNALMGLTVNFKIPRRIRIYSELLIDDLTTGKLGTGYYGNKYAYLLGLRHVEPFSIPNLAIIAEYVRIRPWVYSHKQTITSYQHFNTPMGYRTGPHAQSMTVNFSYTPHYRMGLNIEYKTFSKFGNSELNTGGDMNRPAVQGDPLYINFGDGVKTLTSSICLNVSYQFALGLYLRGGYAHHMADTDHNSSVNRSEWYLAIELNSY